MHLQTQPISPESVSQARTRSQGAQLSDEGVWYRTWCKHSRAEVVILDHAGEELRRVRLQPEPGGYFSGLEEAGSGGDLYKYCFDGRALWPDPASAYQPAGVHGPSMVVDAAAFSWTDQGWVAPALADLVIYEVHLGTFTQQGTFRAAIEHLPHLASLGITAIELMPIADFPGNRNWGYDGVMLSAPARIYGSPDDLRALVDAAHAYGMAVILDVVYNHFGPDGNYTGVYHDGYYAEPREETPWGAALDYSAEPVRAFFVENPGYWRKEFHIDGFRLDATHAIADRSRRHILAELTDAIHAAGAFAIAEDDRRLCSLLRPVASDGLGFDGCWADDFHHVVHVGLTREQEGYYQKFEGDAEELARVLRRGWFPATGEEPNAGRNLEPEKFVFCISNHDQVGNRAFGQRLGHLVGAAEYRAASALLCLAPQTPLLFMGQEWNASTPFQFFTDHNRELGAEITRGRRFEFRHFAAFADEKFRESIPDPQARETFENSRLRWEECMAPAHASMLALYRDCLRLRRSLGDLKGSPEITVDETGNIVIRYGREGDRGLAVVTNLLASSPAPLSLPKSEAGEWHLILSSNDSRFVGSSEQDGSGPTTAMFEFLPNV
jgi:malto-oligosyltrehalose trehalohydrolase